MQHLDFLASPQRVKSLHRKATGQFYTPEVVGRALARQLAIQCADATSLRVIDPFCGDGRLVLWFLEAIAGQDLRFANDEVAVELWDIDRYATELAESAVRFTAATLGIPVLVHAWTGDSLMRDDESRFDVVITNPPWEHLKPDVRDASEIRPGFATEYRDGLRNYAEVLGLHFPNSRPQSGNPLNFSFGVLSRRMAAWAAIFRASAQSRSCDGGRAAPEDRPREGRLHGRGEVQSQTGPTRVRSRAPVTDTYRRSHRADDLAAGP